MRYRQTTDRSTERHDLLWSTNKSKDDTLNHSKTARRYR